MDAELCECPKNLWILYFKWVNYKEGELHLNQAVLTSFFKEPLKKQESSLK